MELRDDIEIYDLKLLLSQMEDAYLQPMSYELYDKIHTQWSTFFQRNNLDVAFQIYFNYEKEDFQIVGLTLSDKLIILSILYLLRWKTDGR